MKLDPRDDEGQYWFYEVHLGDIIRESKLRDYPLTWNLNTSPAVATGFTMQAPRRSM